MTSVLSLRIESACERFEARFGGRPRIYGISPARVELLGNHTDYNGGLVAAAAIDRLTIVVGRATDGAIARIVSDQYPDADEFDLRSIEPGPRGAWQRHVRGVCWALGEDLGGFRSGFEALVTANVPLGAGLSSSASLQAALGRFLIELGIVAPWEGDADSGRMRLARVLNRSENEFVGVGSGLLDQVTCLLGARGQAVVMNCATLEVKRVPLGDPGPALVVCDSRTSRQLADGMYDVRRRECEQAAEELRRFQGRPGSVALAAFDLDDLARAWDRLDPVCRRRARHVLTENDRVRRGAAALERGDLGLFGRLMAESHESSRHDFENSSPELDELIACARSAPGYLGGKLSGAGWAGCTINLVQADQAEQFAAHVQRGYRQATGRDALIHICQADEGAVSGML